MLFAEAIDMHPGWVVAAASMFANMVGGLLAWMKLKRVERSDAVTEWQAIHKRDEDKISTLEKDVKVLQTEHQDCQNRCIELQKEIGTLAGKLAAIEARMNSGQFPKH